MAAPEEEDGAKANEAAPQPTENPAGALPGSSAEKETERREEKHSSDEDDDDHEFDGSEDHLDVAPPPLANSTSFFRLVPSEEALIEATALKAAGNDAFGSGAFEEAVVTYKEALEKLGDEIEEEEEEEEEEEAKEEEDEKQSEEEENPTPSTSEEATELGATLHANLSASYLKLSNFPDARDSADAALRLLAKKKKEKKKEEGKKTLLVAKALLRRAAGAAGEGDFASAAADARRAAEEASIPSSDSGAAAALLAKQASAAADEYDRKAAEAAERARDEVVGKLKELGNSLLGRFGLSLDSFAAEKDPETGAYSIKFNQGGKGGGAGAVEQAKPLGRS